jgi:hypothetical protein
VKWLKGEFVPGWPEAVVRVTQFPRRNCSPVDAGPAGRVFAVYYPKTRPSSSHLTASGTGQRQRAGR